MESGTSVFAHLLDAPGGRHLIYRQPEGVSLRNSAGKLAPAVDIRADGGYIIAPPSVFKGVPYRWAETFELVPPDQLTVVPDWIVALLSEVSQDPTLLENIIPLHERNDTLARLAGSMRRVGMSEAEILAALLKVNEDRCRPRLSSHEVRKVARSISRYEPDQIATAIAENHYGHNQRGEPSEEEAAPSSKDPGPLLDEQLRVPGFVSEVMDHCLAIAPYPNQVMALCGALALQAVLAGRKVRDPGDNRSNLYLLGLAHSASGKDAPRKLNTEIMHAVGLSTQVGVRFASGEGLQDALFLEPSMLFQTDEIDGMLQSINKSKDARHESIMGTLLTMYSSANSVFPMRAKAGREAPGAIDQPNLVVFGTAIPNHYYDALSERMLTNGFFARMIILECGKRSPGQEPSIRPLPTRILETAQWWAGSRPGVGNLQNWHPEPLVVQQTDEAKNILVETRLESEGEYSKAEELCDAVSTTVWGRVNEHARKLALIYAVSENHEHPEIGKAAAEWARRFVMHLIRRMLFMAQEFVADNPFHAECLKALKKLREAPGGELTHSVLLKRMKIGANDFTNLIATLMQRGDIEVRPRATSGRSGKSYRLASMSPAGSSSDRQ